MSIEAIFTRQQESITIFSLLLALHFKLDKQVKLYLNLKNIKETQFVIGEKEQTNH